MKRHIYLIAWLFLSMFIFTGCATQSAGNITYPPGFWHGLFHGFIILFSFIVGLFTDYEIYAFPNSGGWYNFGFLIGVMMFGGGGGASSKRRK
ncbi:hypothetical protein [uncultured Sunxiuqinia sp.]|uniref:hypothetical protein n=1 Tax=uncultured Sunxiuqinia sp. TaxID=1573825 RepID=UPI002AA6AB36|nr:hypothetical protein [uncultured Sunxiuqinia sp.]